MRDFEILKEVIGSASFTVFADLPFIILFLFVLYAIGGPVAAVPALVVPVVILFGLLLQPIMRKISDLSTQQGQSKQAVMVEMLSNLQTLKTVRGISILRNRWFQGVLNQGMAQRRSRFYHPTGHSFHPAWPAGLTGGDHRLRRLPDRQR